MFHLIKPSRSKIMSKVWGSISNIIYILRSSNDHSCPINQYISNCFLYTRIITALFFIKSTQSFTHQCTATKLLIPAYSNLSTFWFHNIRLSNIFPNWQNPFLFLGISNRLAGQLSYGWIDINKFSKEKISYWLYFFMEKHSNATYVVKASIRLFPKCSPINIQVVCTDTDMSVLYVEKTLC